MIVNLGDSRVIMYDNNNKILSNDFGHKPDNPKEAKRI